MGERQEFGPNLRQARLRKGITLAQLAEATKVGTDLWQGLERNELSRWPSGLYARSYVRSYAIAVGLDPEATVDEFCRCFPAGDRRAGRIVKEQAALLGHDLQWEDEVAHLEADRRAAPAEPDRLPKAIKKGGRLIAAIVDAGTVLGVATIASALLPTSWAGAAAVCAVVYHGGSLLLLGASPSAWAIQTYLSSRHPAGRLAGAPRFIRLVRGSERA